MLAAACRILSQCLPRKFLPKTICSSDYRAGCSHKLVSTVCIIDCENSLCNKWGEQIFGIFGPNFQFGVCRSAPSLLGYLFNIFPRGSLSIRRRTAVASAQPALNRDCGAVQRKRQLRNISKRSIWISPKYLDIGQVSGYQPTIWISAKYLDIGQVSGYRKNILISAKYRDISQVSGY